MMEPEPHPSADAARTIETSRILNVPRERIIRAWIDPDRLARWWGPKDFTNTFHECDPRPGGTWRFTMHGPNGANFENQSIFEEVSLPERIVIHHLSPPDFRLTATFENLGERTRIVWRMVFATAELAEKVRGFAPAANEQNLDRLEAELARMA